MHRRRLLAVLPLLSLAALPAGAQSTIRRTNAPYARLQVRLSPSPYSDLPPVDVPLWQSLPVRAAEFSHGPGGVTRTLIDVRALPALEDASPRRRRSSDLALPVGFVLGVQGVNRVFDGRTCIRPGFGQTVCDTAIREEPVELPPIVVHLRVGEAAPLFAVSGLEVSVIRLPDIPI